jgi:predicted GH43/DUF377 family glycosyl hydrolase
MPEQMKWRKLGKVFQPSGELDWARTHAANPTPEHIKGDIFRIYFSARDAKNRSSIGYVVVDLSDNARVLDVPSEPVLRPGDLGMFDDCGASIGCIVRMGSARYLYYMGWNLAVTVPWKNAIGLAISESEDAPFRRVSRFPMMPLDEIDPYTISYPWVMKDGSRYRMWYGSNLRWGPEKKDMLHVIKYAESADAVHWEKPDRVVIDSASPEENAICKPCVIKDADCYRMWFCSRGEKYRIQYAESEDGTTWTRLGQDQGIDVSPDGWDSDMIEFPCIFDHGGRRYLLYAGNAFGATGFGLAVQET